MSYSSKDRAPVVIGVCAFLIIVALVATVLRLYARRLVRLSLWWDDWLCILGLPFALLPMIFDFIQIHNGFGRHESTLSEGTLVHYAKYFYLLMLLYNLGLAFFKFSLLAFYIRVFSVIKTIRIASSIIGGLIFAWTLATEFLLIFRCHPIEISWAETTEQQTNHCISVYTVFIAQAAPTIFFDILILLLPLRQIWTLQLNTSQKVGVSTAFALGFVVTIISILRLVEIFSTGTTDFTYDFVSLGLLSAAEPVTGLVCCSLVTYGPFVQIFSRMLRANRQGTDDSSNNTYSSQDMGYRRQRLRFGDEVQLVNFNRSMTTESAVLQKDHAIHVRREYSVRHM